MMDPGPVPDLAFAQRAFPENALLRRIDRGIHAIHAREHQGPHPAIGGRPGLCAGGGRRRAHSRFGGTDRARRPLDRGAAAAPALERASSLLERPPPCHQWADAAGPPGAGARHRAARRIVRSHDQRDRHENPHRRHHRADRLDRDDGGSSRRRSLRCTRPCRGRRHHAGPQACDAGTHPAPGRRYRDRRPDGQHRIDDVRSRAPIRRQPVRVGGSGRPGGRPRRTADAEQPDRRPADRHHAADPSRGRGRGRDPMGPRRGDQLDLCGARAVGPAADDRAAELFHREAVRELDPGLDRPHRLGVVSPGLHGADRALARQGDRDRQGFALLGRRHRSSCRCRTPRRARSSCG